MSNATSNAQARIDSLLDADSFVEIGSQVTARSTDFNMTEKETPSDGVITGYGVIDGSLVYVYSQDVSVLGGTIGEMHAKKIKRLYDMALKVGAPIIGLIDSNGLRLQEGCDALYGFGEIYMQQVKASGVIPQISAVFGMAGGGMGVVPSLGDFTFMEEKKGKLFISAPNTLDNNNSEEVDTSKASYHDSETGDVDFVGSEEEIISNMRYLISILPSNNEDEAYDAASDDCNRSVPSLPSFTGDTTHFLREISDNRMMLEMKSGFGPEMVTAFIRLNGMTVGAIANRSEILDENGEVAASFDPVLGSRGAKKAASFANFCDAFSIPLLTVTNVTGFKAVKASERKMAKAAARLTYAFAAATVPKINIITLNGFGSAYVSMNSKSIGADMVFAWPEAKIGMMDAGMAAKIMYADADAEIISEKAAEYDVLQNNVMSAARRGYVDTIIAPEDTRKYVIGAFEMLYSKRMKSMDKKHGTV